MTGAEYRTVLQHFGLSHVRAAKWLGVSQRTGQNYATRGPPEPIAVLLRLAIRLGLTAADLKGN